MQTQTKPVFKGKALIEIPSVFPQIGFLEGDFGKEFLEEYNGRMNADYKGDISALNVLGYNGSTVTGSNPFAVVFTNQILRGQGLRTATQSDLETAMRIGAMNFRGTYEDTALILRTEEDKDYSRNTLLARDLGKQLKARKVKFGAKNPVVVPLTGLELQTSQDNGYGFTLRLREDAEVYEAPILKEDGRFSSEDIDEKTGLPRQLGEGNRTLYTRNLGLSGLCLNSVLIVVSGDRSLDYSDDVGRVVLVSAEGTSPDFDGRLNEMQSQIAEARQSYLTKLSQIRDNIDGELKGSR